MRLSEGRFLHFLMDFAESLARPWALGGRFRSLLLVASGDIIAHSMYNDLAHLIFYTWF